MHPNIFYAIIYIYIFNSDHNLLDWFHDSLMGWGQQFENHRSTLIPYVVEQEIKVKKG